MRLQLPSLVCALGLAAPSLAHAWAPPEAAEADAEGSASLSLSGDGAEAQTDVSGASSTDADEQESNTRKWNPRKDKPWLERWAPEPHMFELGVYAGLFQLNGEHELFEPNSTLPMQGWLPLRRSNPDLGGRIGYYPLRFFGIEAEGGVIPSKLDNASGTGVLPFTVRGHAVAQLGLWSVTPFVLVGAGMLGVNGGPLGKDIDPAMHFGAGVKIYLNRWLMLRLDARDVVSHALGVDNTFVSHNFEGLIGLSVTLNRKNQPPAQADEPAVIPAGPGDRDGDGIRDTDDQCIDVPETVNNYQDDDGCPESDRDGDGFWDDQDTCPDEPGVDPDGCPLNDTDGDGFLDDVDQCIEEPETENGFEDEDGCPDEVPAEILRFNGAIKGITFETNKATIDRSSLPTLDEAIRVLQQHPSVRIEVAGHTDNRGKQDHNMQLSRERAESVMSYLVGMGIAEDRVTTAGFGPDVPIDTNDTKAGRANNRRIEFRVITGARSTQSTETRDDAVRP